MNKKLLAVSFASALAVTACVSSMKNSGRGVATEGYETSFLSNNPARKFKADDIKKIASSGKLDLKEARLITDNDASFDSKLEMIKRAKKEIRMVYFIYSDDDSSSLISQALIEKAKKGVQVKLLVDFITNSSKMDHLQMMVNEGGGNLQVKFYNFPSPRILADAKYITLPCPDQKAESYDQCLKFKEPLMAGLKSQDTTPFSKMFLAGVYGRSSTALKVAMGYGAGIEPAKLKAMKDETDEHETARIFDFFKLAKDALGGSLSAKIKIQAALASDGATLNPVLDLLIGRFPIINPTGSPEDQNHAAELDHLTDYVHHKLVAIDGTEFQLGGRNVEDSYHMKYRMGTKGKYIFVDTDFYGKTAAGGTKEIEDSFDKMFDRFDDMVAPIQKVQGLIGYDMSSNPQALGMAAGGCYEQAKKGKVQMAMLGSCIEQTLPTIPGFKSQKQRSDAAKKEMEASSKRYKEYKKTYVDNIKNAPYAAGIDSISQGDLANSEVYYLENISYDRHASEFKRKTGSRVGAEAKFNKNIHAAWYRDLENACVVSREEKREVRVVFHSAYLFMPSGLTHRLARMLNGDYGNCSGVRITFLTNSFATTDLNVINVFARYQMSKLFKYYAGKVAYEQQFNEENKGIRKYGRMFPTLEYYEYNASSVGAGKSLHTKLSLIGDDMIVGSANTDVRSYYMDTNNAVLIRNAKELNADYLRFIDGIIGDKTKSSNETDYYTRVSDAELAAGNKVILAAMKARWDKKNRITPERQEQILAEISHIGGRITEDTQRMLNFRGDFEMLNIYGDANQSDFERSMNKLVNDFDNTFETL